jgi:RNA polymerase sigma factor (sigma-70 family)
MSPSVSVRLLATQSDARLVALARQGHERAFEALVQRHRRALLAYCRRVLLPDERAEDALQQGLLQAWLALQNGAEVRDARAWLYRIVHNAALNTLRGARYDFAELSEALSGAGAPQEDLDRRIAIREALAGLAALPELQREALMRTAVEGHSHQQVAAAMGVSEGALRGLVYRARVTLRTAVTAITPAPLISWAAGAGGGHGGVALAELAAGGGSVGLGGLLLKGGAVAVTAGVLATGVGSVEHHRHATHRGAQQQAVAAGAGAVAGGTTRLVSAPVGSVPSASPHHVRRAGGSQRHRHGEDRRAAVAPALRRRPIVLAARTRHRVTAAVAAMDTAAVGTTGSGDRGGAGGRGGPPRRGGSGPGAGGDDSSSGRSGPSSGGGRTDGSGDDAARGGSGAEDPRAAD